ncbi:methionine--tRNA ligase [Helicobacter sp. 16-1353]|uniref:methionine--tRNA ligase n=1 Tax=Helicobacter sp. 16-1353 TaxID=2004996 RepID=UPI000DCB6015|nr:methionine--tRNA ligase [Helicobacter sp. 16-1353]RAX53892.1 methionine--tRNA ligase [Helicobacter sp. 16-1353]
MTKYVTTPIYYVNDVPHIGHAYTTILCDMFKRYQVLKGNECVLLTGTDEHGQKIENSAKLKQKSTQEYADEISFKFQNLWNNFGIAYDYFVRTTDKYHDIGVKYAFEEMYRNGDIYKGHYEGNYCISCETFFTKRQLVDEFFCPDCGKETTPLKEESYFFRLSKYENKLLEWYKENPNIILPLHKKNEIIKFIEGGLSDLSITRSGFKWGISLPPFVNDDKHIIYVWLDALLSYITPLGFGNDNLNKMYFFNDATHFVGKDILRFHAIYWPAFLMSLNLPLPKKIYAHGWWTRDGAKMSKSVGNVINPEEIANTYGLENMRYFLIREVPFGQDGDFSRKALIERSNSELSDTLGNLLSRLLGMGEKYFNLTIESNNFDYLKNEIDEVAIIIESLEYYMENMMPNRYLEELWKIFNIANLSITKYAPWDMMKEQKVDDVATLLVFVANILAKGSLLLYPILPNSSKEIMKSLGVDFSHYNKIILDNELINTFKLTKIPPLFPKIEKPAIETNINKINLKDEINIKQFDKIDIRVGKILEAKRIEKSNNLLVLNIDFGESIGTRQIVSGIANFYKPENINGVLACAIINLKPSKIMGVLSQGMILTTEDSKGNLSLLSVYSNTELGSKIG